MAKIRDPRRFSELFGVRPQLLARRRVFDPSLNVDTRLFIDPLLLRRSQHRDMRNAGRRFRKHFEEIIRLLRVMRRLDDPAGRAARRLFVSHEVKATCIGYGANSIHGSGFGSGLTGLVLDTAKQIVDLGISDPDLFALLGLFEDDIGPDRISDLTTNVILEDLAAFTIRALAGQRTVPNDSYTIGGRSFRLPRNPLETKSTPVILVPLDVLRDLPIASDRSEIAHVAAENSAIRRSVNTYIGVIWKSSAKGRNGVRLHEDGAALSIGGDEIVVGAERRWPRCCQ